MSLRHSWKLGLSGSDPCVASVLGRLSVDGATGATWCCLGYGLQILCGKDLSGSKLPFSGWSPTLSPALRPETLCHTSCEIGFLIKLMVLKGEIDRLFWSPQHPSSPNVEKLLGGQQAKGTWRHCQPLGAQRGPLVGLGTSCQGRMSSCTCGSSTKTP